MRNQKGITLIALIVTIIVLIIIAGISIATLTADNGILRQVDSAKVATIEGNAKEQVQLACAALRLAIAEAQAKDNSYKANFNATKIQDTMVSLLIADNTNLSAYKEDGVTASWAEGTAAQNSTTASTAATFTVVYTGADYTQACNNSAANITFTVTLNQTSIEWTNTATGISKPAGSKGETITVNDIKA